jgi:hypothetical protein
MLASGIRPQKVTTSLIRRLRGSACIPFSGLYGDGGEAFNDPLGFALTPNHHLVAANGDDGNIVETNPVNGKQIAVKLVDNTEGRLRDRARYSV